MSDEKVKIDFTNIGEVTIEVKGEIQILTQNDINMLIEKLTRARAEEEKIRKNILELESILKYYNGGPKKVVFQNMESFLLTKQEV